GMTAIAIISPKVLPLVLVMSVVLIGVTLLQLPLGMQALGWSRDELGTVTAKFEEDFAARQEIKNLGAHAVQTRKFVDASWDRRRARWWAAIVTNGYAALMAFLGQLTAALVLWKGGEYVLAGALSIGTALSLRVPASRASPSCWDGPTTPLPGRCGSTASTCATSTWRPTGPGSASFPRTPSCSRARRRPTSPTASRTPPSTRSRRPCGVWAPLT